MTEQKINVAVVGAGTVGSGTVACLTKNAADIAVRAVPVCLTWLAEKDLPRGRAVLDELGLTETRLTDRWQDVVEDPEVDVVVELIGGVTLAKEIIAAALRAGKSAVTANKDLMAVAGGELLNIAAEHQTDLLFEASVGGGIPIILPLKESLAGNSIDSVMGIVNGTTNYILTQMSETGAAYSDALKKAQELGYAEQDPTADVEGLDAARKVAILASICFNSRVTLDMVSHEGITKICDRDILYAKELGYAVKMLGIARCDGSAIEARVHPVLIAQSHPLAAVNDSYNAIFVHGDCVENAMFYGRGAGSLPTGSAVVGDIIIAARNIAHHCKARWGCTCYKELPVLPEAETSSKYYIRLSVNDETGVMAMLAQVMADAQVSMDAVIQKRRLENQGAELVIITHKVRHQNIANALDVLRLLQCVRSVDGFIRVED